MACIGVYLIASSLSGVDNNKAELYIGIALILAGLIGIQSLCGCSDGSDGICCCFSMNYMMMDMISDDVI